MVRSKEYTPYGLTTILYGFQHYESWNRFKFIEILCYMVRLEIEGSLDRDSLEVLCCVSVGKALNILCCVLVKHKKTGNRPDMTENVDRDVKPHNTNKALLDRRVRRPSVQISI